MSAPPEFIEGVIVLRKSERYNINGSKKYQQCSFQSSVLVPGNHCSFPTPGLGLKLRIYCPFDSPLECPSKAHACPIKSLKYTSEGPEGRPEVGGDGPFGYGPFIVFRKDYKPLQPNQVQVLWKYLRYFVSRTDYCGPGPAYSRLPILDNMNYRSKLTNGRTGIVDTNGQEWHYDDFLKAYFTLDNFHAFFYVTKHRRLSEGDESWRDAVSPYDE